MRWKAAQDSQIKVVLKKPPRPAASRLTGAEFVAWSAAARKPY